MKTFTRDQLFHLKGLGELFALPAVFISEQAGLSPEATLRRAAAQPCRRLPRFTERGRTGTNWGVKPPHAHAGGLVGQQAPNLYVLTGFLLRNSLFCRLRAEKRLGELVTTDKQLCPAGGRRLSCESEMQRGLGIIPAIPLLLPRGGKSHSVQAAPPQLRVRIRRRVQQQRVKAQGFLGVLACKMLVVLT